MTYFTKGTYAKATILGNIGKKELVEIKYNGEPLPILRLQIAVNFQNGEEHTEWLPVSLAGTRAEKLNEILKVGDKVLVEGPIRTNTWQNGDSFRKKIYFQADRVVFVSRKREGTSENEETQNAEEVPAEEDTPFGVDIDGEPPF